MCVSSIQRFSLCGFSCREQEKACPTLQTCLFKLSAIALGAGLGLGLLFAFQTNSLGLTQRQMIKIMEACFLTGICFAALGKMQSGRKQPARMDRVYPLPDLGKSFFDVVDPLPENQIALQDSSQNLIASYEGHCLLNAQTLSKDVCIYIATFLNPRSVVLSMSVSKQFCEIMRSDVLWSPYLAHEEYRIWGATGWVFKRGTQGYVFENLQEKIDAFQQMRTFHALRKTRQIGFEDFLSYLARLMPGGPVAFSAIPHLQVKDASEIRVENMSTSILRATDEQNHSILAMRVQDSAKEGTSPILLLFIRYGNQWVQEANPYWKKNELKLTRQNDQNYILALISRAPLETRIDFTAASLKKTIKLV